MRRSYKSLLIAAGIAGCCAAGASPAAADNIDGWACGLTASGGNYVIANCHTYPVYRTVIKSDFSTGSCRYIPARGLVSGSSSLTIIDYAVCTP